jgi:hypothetical protein
MRWRGVFLRCALLGALALIALPGDTRSWAKEPEHNSALWIAADRVVGFAPFKVYIYGKIQGPQPEEIKLCRSEVAPIAEESSAGVGGARSRNREPRASSGRLPECSKGKLTPSSEGFVFSHDLRFSHPGAYHLRLTVIDAAGKRTVSNTVRVNAF